MISSGVSEGAGVFLAEEGGEKKRINIMSSNCLCVHLSLSLLLPPSFYFPSHPTTLRQLLLSSKLAAPEFLLGNYEINNSISSDRECFWLHLTASDAASIQDVVPNPLQGDFFSTPNPFLWITPWSRSGLIRLGNILTGSGQRISLNHWPYLCATF